MKRILWSLTLTIVVCSCMARSFGQLEILKDGNSLLRSCEVAVHPVDQIGHEEFKAFINCYAYVDGVVKGFGYAGGELCIPDEVELAQAVRVVVKYLNEHPEELHEPSYVLIVRSQRKAFPCKKK